MKVQELFAGMWSDGASCAKVIPLLRGTGCKVVSLLGERATRMIEEPAAREKAVVAADVGVPENDVALVFVATFSPDEIKTLTGLAGHDSAAAAAQKNKLIADAIESWARPQAATVEGGLAPWQILRTEALVERRMEERLTTAELATAVRLSAGYFARAFKRSFGVSPHLYLMKRRVARAKHLMTTTSRPLSEIALSCGLSDQAHLSRIFRQHEGETPNRWRRRSKPALQAA
jgi:AraC family transcriptional regulator